MSFQDRKFDTSQQPKRLRHSSYLFSFARNISVPDLSSGQQSGNIHEPQCFVPPSGHCDGNTESDDRRRSLLMHICDFVLGGGVKTGQTVSLLVSHPELVRAP